MKQSININEDYITQKRIDLGLRIKAIREEKGLTPAELGEQIGLGKYAIGQIESGKWNMSYAHLVMLSVALEFNIELVLK